MPLMLRYAASFAACCVLSLSCLLWSGCAGGASNSGGTTPGNPTTPAVATPTITSITPTKIGAGAGTALTLTINGTNFIASSTAQVGTVAEATTYVSATQLTATVPAAQLASGAMLPIVILNGTVTSASSGTLANLEVDNPAPSIQSFTPAGFAVGASSTTVSIVGTGFVPTTVINVNGSSRSTTFVSSTQVNTILTVADLSTASALNLSAVNSSPGGGTSAAASLPVNNPAPTIVAINPTSVAAGTASSTPITIAGTNFVAGSTVLVGTTAHAAVVVSATQITSALSAADVATAGKLNVTVVNPTPGGGTSNAGSVTVSTPSPTPVLTSLAPGTILVGSGGTTVTVYGSNLNSSCQILWNSTSLTYALGSGYTLVNGSYVYSLYAAATVPANLVTSLGTSSVTANCPTALSPVSNALTVTVANPPVPALASITPTVGPIGTAQQIVFTGTGFTSKSTVSYNGVALSTTFTSSTSLSATLPASSNVLPGIGSFTVNTPAPGGGTSGSVAFTAYVPLVNNDMIYNPVNGLFYASVPSSAGAPYGNTIVPIDPATGAFGTPIPVGSEPDRLAVTSDGKYLWVGLDGANAVRKVDLTSGTAGLQFSIPQQTTNSVGNSSAYALAALPGATDSVLVSSADFPNYFAIYDSGVVRGSAVTGYYTQPYAILADGSKNEVYASGFNGYQTFNYTSSGLTLRSTSNAGISVSYGGDMQIAGAKLYPSNGKVYDPESGALQGTLYLSGSTVASGSTFADAVLGKIFVLDVPSNYVYSNSYQVQVFSATDYTSSTAIPISVSATATYSTPNRLTRWGSNGLAFRNTNGLYSLRSNLVKDLSGASADLGVTITSSGTTTSAPVTFTLTVINNGGSASTNAVLAAFLPTNGTLLSATTTVGSCSSVSTLSCALGSLANGASATITASIQPLTAGNLTLGAQVMGSENDSVPSNNTASSTVVITGSDYNPSPTLTSITPAAIKAGSPDTTLTINGAGYNSGSTVRLGTATLTATLVSSTQMTATIPAASLGSMGWAPVSVTNPSPGGGASASAPLTIFNVLSAGLNDLAYEPFSRKIFASVGSGAANLTGNSIVQITPESGTFGTAANVGSQPTRIALTSDGKYLYTTLSGANSIARFNIATNTTDFTFSPTLPTNYFASTAGFGDVAVQPGSETVLALSYSGYSGTGLVDVNVANHAATLRGGTVTSNYSSNSFGTTHFLNASSLFIYDGSLEQYGVPAAGLSTSTTHTGIYLQPFGSFMLSGGYAYSDNGGLANVSGSVPVQLGVFQSLSGSTYSYNQKVAGDAGLNRAFFAGYTGAASYSSTVDGIIAYDQSTLLPTTVLPLGMAAIEGTSSYTVNDLIRWGQDGLAMLTSTGHVYLLRGAAVVPGLLTSNTVAILTGASTTAVAHGSDNILLTLTGANFQPGVAVNWNGVYRTTTIVDATHVTVAIPASDLATAGSATLTAVNPGAGASAALTFLIN